MAEQIRETDLDAQERQPWTAPSLLQLEIEDAEAGPGGTTDAGIFS